MALKVVPKPEPDFAKWLAKNPAPTLAALLAAWGRPDQVPIEAWRAHIHAVQDWNQRRLNRLGPITAPAPKAARRKRAPRRKPQVSPKK